MISNPVTKYTRYGEPAVDDSRSLIRIVYSLVKNTGVHDNYEYF